MLKKIAIASVVFAASMLAANRSYKVEILENTMLAGKQIRAGDYKVEMDGSHAILRRGKESVSVPAHTEQAQAKYNNTQVQYVNSAINEIHIGGTNMKIVFTPAAEGAAGGAN